MALNPYDSPYEGLIAFMNTLNDLIFRTKEYQTKQAGTVSPASIQV